MADWYSKRFPDDEYYRRVGEIIEGGLPCRVWPRVTASGLAMLQLEPLQGWVDLANEQAILEEHMAGWDYHVSVCFDTELDLDVWDRLVRRWAGRVVRLRIARVTSGATAVLADSCPLGSDPDIRALHSAGWYCQRELHVSM